MAENILMGNEVASDLPARTQVYQATHDGEGQRLPHMLRSFISFSYGGKFIEDFGVISVIEGDRITRNAYANFEDLTSTYSVMDGQFYWGTHFTTNHISFSLATDGMTQNQLDEFRYWFMPGQIRELVLAEHPNRGILARVETTPTYSLLPFEQLTTIQVDANIYEVSTTIYKGNIQLSFVMDEPFWYSIQNFIEDTVVDVNGNTIAALQNKDTLKVMLEDGIPTVQSLMPNCFLGNNYFVTNGGAIAGTVPIYSQVGLAVIGVQVGLRSGININDQAIYYLYYCGTAPAYPILQFTLRPQFNDAGYIIAPYNNIASINDKPQYNTLQVGSATFSFSTPGMYTGYNQALQLVDSFDNTNASYVEVLNALRLGIKEYYARAWAIYVMEKLFSENTLLPTGWKADFKEDMKQFLFDSDTNIGLSATFIFDSSTGEALGKFNCRSAELQKTQDNSLNNTETIIIQEENVGDMVCSDYLIIRDRNILGSTRKLTVDNCSAITTDYPTELTDALILYKNMYL